MTMTSSETQWVARVMHTISYVAFIESCNTVTGYKKARERKSYAPREASSKS